MTWLSYILLSIIILIISRRSNLSITNLSNIRYFDTLIYYHLFYIIIDIKNIDVIISNVINKVTCKIIHRYKLQILKLFFLIDKALVYQYRKFWKTKNCKSINRFFLWLGYELRVWSYRCNYNLPFDRPCKWRAQQDRLSILTISLSIVHTISSHIRVILLFVSFPSRFADDLRWSCLFHSITCVYFSFIDP